MAKVSLIIDNNPVSFEESTTLLQAFKSLGISIPTLCNHPELKPNGSCRLCSVEIEGEESLVPSCAVVVEDGMVVKTDTERVKNARKTILELIIANHPNDCATCQKAMGDCELQNLCFEIGINRSNQMFKGDVRNKGIDSSSITIVRDMGKCILCGRCVNMCKEVQGIGIYDFMGRGFDAIVTTVDDIPIAETKCVSCGQCIKACPVGALYEKVDIYDAIEALRDPDKHVIFQMAPAVKNTLGEEFGLPAGTDVTGKVAAALRRLGADRIFNTDFAADVTIMEEGTEFINRLKDGENLPLLTSCCPGWVTFVEHNYPELLDNVSSCKSPQQMFGALSKSYYSKVSGVASENIYSISIMPCIAKKYEANRPEMEVHGEREVDLVITTREFAKLIKMHNIDFLNLKDESFDKFLGNATGAARIFASSGGVMEAALRTVTYTLTDGEMNAIDYKIVRGLEGTKEAEINIGGKNVKVAVVNGTRNIRELLDKVLSGEKSYDFIELMACPGGCINGGGAPIPDNRETLEKRKNGIYNSDSKNSIRRSFESPEIVALYKEYLGDPGEHTAHHLLHTHYTDRSSKYGMFK